MSENPCCNFSVSKTENGFQIEVTGACCEEMWQRLQESGCCADKSSESGSCCD